MKRFVLAGVLLVVLGTPVWAGVVIEMEGVVSESGGEAGTDMIYAQGKMLRMDPHESRGGQASMIFRGDELLIVDRDKNRCQKIDERGVRELSEQLGGAMKQMEEQLAQLPPEQRKMMEKMMKDRMPPGMGQEAPPRRVEKGDTEQIGDYTCVVHTLYSGDDKVWEVCSAKESAVSAFTEAMEGFRAMSDFTEQLREMAMRGPFANMFQTPFSDMDSIGGVPIRVRTFAHGQQQSESTLKSVSAKDLDDDFFTAPKGCKVKNLADEIKGGR